MKTRIFKTEGTSLNHNASGLRIKPQILMRVVANQNQSGLKIKPEVRQRLAANHNESSLKSKPQVVQGSADTPKRVG